MKKESLLIILFLLINVSIRIHCSEMRAEI